MGTRPRAILQRTATALVFVVLAALVAQSAMITKRAVRHGQLAPLASVDVSASQTVRSPKLAGAGFVAGSAPTQRYHIAEHAPGSTETRWFNGRPVRPARTIWMRVTAYSPDERSCGKWADGKTATMHSVWTNGMRLVAADTRILPFGSMVSVPGYAEGEVVPVLDRGGAIKGARLDVLYPTHEIARRWGVQWLPVTVWEYADGRPADDFRRIRDSRY